MLTQPTLDQLQELRFYGMLKAIEEQDNTPDCASLSFEERFALLIEREYIERHNRRLTNRLRKAKFPMQAAVEDINFRHPRGLDKSQIMSLFSCQWIRSHDNIIFTGPTGTGKTYLSCAFGHKACRENLSVLYLRLPRLFEELAIAKGKREAAKTPEFAIEISVITPTTAVSVPITGPPRALATE